MTDKQECWCALLRLSKQAPRSHQSHLATALGLPACNFMAQKYNVSFCQHSLLMEAHSFTAVYSMPPATLWYCENVAQYIYSIFNFAWFLMCLTEGDIKAKKRRCDLRDKCEIDGNCESLLSLTGNAFQLWWSTILWRLITVSQKCSLPPSLSPSLFIALYVQTTNDKSPMRTLQEHTASCIINNIHLSPF